MDAHSDLKDLTPGQLERAQSLAKEGYSPEQIETFLRAERRIAEGFRLRALPGMERISHSEEKLAKQWFQGGLSADTVAQKLSERREAHEAVRAARRAIQSKAPRLPE